jgi:LysM repeat protein
VAESESKRPTEVVTPEPIVKPSVPSPVVAPAVPTVVAPVAVPPAKPAVRPTSVVVGEGETLASIAKRWGVTVPSLMEANDLVRDRVSPGTRLKLPPAAKR